MLQWLQSLHTRFIKQRRCAAVMTKHAAATMANICSCQAVTGTSQLQHSHWQDDVSCCMFAASQEAHVTGITCARWNVMVHGRNESRRTGYQHRLLFLNPQSLGTLPALSSLEPAKLPCQVSSSCKLSPLSTAARSASVGCFSALGGGVN